MCMGREFWSFGLGVINLDLGNLVVASVPKVSMPMWPVHAYGLPMRGDCTGAWNFGPVTFDLGAMTLNLKLVWTLLFLSYWCQCGQFVPVDYMRGSCARASIFGPVTFDLGAMTLTLGFLWMLLCPSY